MVGLKTDDDVSVPPRKHTFTFHYGWIKNKFYLTNNAERMGFTFHYGWIKNLRERLLLWENTYIYIPLWLD